MRCWFWLVWFFCSIPVAQGHSEGQSVHRMHSELDVSIRPVPVSDVPSTPTLGPDRIVYGYLAFWADDMQTVPWDNLSHIALFAANAHTDGTLSQTKRWGDIEQALAYAQTYSVRVHLTVVNFDTEELRTLLGDEAARSRLIATLKDIVDETGVDGVNIDFEGVPVERRDAMVSFIRDLSTVVDEVVVATPAVDWSKAWDYAALTDYADLFIMGYGYHWSGSTYAGPVDPLYGGGPWGVHSLNWTAEKYLSEGADPERVIMGLPLYGSRWPTSDNAVPTQNLGSGSAVFWGDAHREAAVYGQGIESQSDTPYFYDGSGQTWFGTAETVRRRVQRMMELGLGGIGFWALNYDEGDAALWAGVYEETHTTSPTENIQIAVEEVTLAYVGHVVDVPVFISGPDEVDVVWTQVGGPEVTWESLDTHVLRVDVQHEGVYEFSVTVQAADSVTTSASVFVIGVRTAADPALVCGCRTGGPLKSAPVLLCFVLSVFQIRRRREMRLCEK